MSKLKLITIILFSTSVLVTFAFWQFISKWWQSFSETVLMIEDPVIYWGLLFGILLLVLIAGSLYKKKTVFSVIKDILN